MSELVLISHGKMAEGIKDSLELIMGPQEHIHTVCLLPNEGQELFEKKFNEVVSSFQSETEITVFADLMGGTPANTLSKLIMSGKDIHLIAGMNLPMVIKWVNDQMIGDQSNYVEAAQQGIVDINEMISNM